MILLQQWTKELTKQLSPENWCSSLHILGMTKWFSVFKAGFGMNVEQTWLLETIYFYKQSLIGSLDSIRKMIISLQIWTVLLRFHIAWSTLSKIRIHIILGMFRQRIWLYSTLVLKNWEKQTCKIMGQLTL